MEQKIKLLEQKKSEALVGGGEKRIEQQHKKGKLTALSSKIMILYLQLRVSV